MTLKVLVAPAVTAALACAGCASVPPGPPAEVARLQIELDHLHADRRISANGGIELDNADAAVALLAQNARSLDAHAYQQGVYISDKLIAIAEATARARAAEEEGQQFGAERDRLLAPYGAARVSMMSGQPESDLHARTSGPPPKANAELMAMQNRLEGLESRVDERGLVVRIGNFMFEPGQPTLTSKAERSLDSLVRALRDESGAVTRVEGHGPDEDVSLARSAAVRDYLKLRGAGSARIEKPSGAAMDGAPAFDRTTARVDVVINIED